MKRFRILTDRRQTACLASIMSIWFLISLPAYSQNQIDIQIDQILENYLENVDEAIDYSELQDQLIHLYQNPVSLNNGTADELRKIFFLSEAQIADILNYRRKHLFFSSIYELAYIPSINNEVLFSLLPFIQIDSKTYKRDMKSMLTYGRQQLIFKTESVLEQKEGYQKSNGYLGNPLKIYSRYNYQLFDNLSFGVTAEKDPGESFLDSNQPYGFDYYSVHAFYQGDKTIKALAIGDFSANFGQGLILHNSFALGKSSSILNFYKHGSPIKAYRSVNESQFFRGSGVVLQLGKTELTAFYSNRNKDATLINDTSALEENLITGFYESGYHRTQSELTKKHEVSEQTYGMRISRSLGELKLALSAIGGNINPPIESASEPYKMYGFSGSKHLNFSSDFTWSFNNLFTFGEIATDTRHQAILLGSLMNLGSNLKAGLLYRNFNKAYTSLYGNAFAENSSVQNEEGLYLALNMIPVQKVSINLYSDLYRFPWLRYQNNHTSGGFEFFSELTWHINYYSKVRYRYQIKNSDKNFSDPSQNLNPILNNTWIRQRLQIDKTLDKHLKTSLRIEYSAYKNEEENFKGLLSFAELSYHPSNYKYLISGRFAIFNTDDYASRIYTYEKDLLYSFSIPSFNGLGSRMYALFQYNLNTQLSLWLKIAQTNYFDRNSIGSGNEQINNTHKTELKFMAMWSF